MMAATELHKWQGELLEQEPMSRHTTWRVGGPARRYYRPASLDDLALFLQELAEDESLYWFGLGSNLLVRDGGIDGTVIATAGVLDGIVQLDDGRIRVECGVSCAKLARYCARHGLAGAEFLNGIPGCLGGALAMNAGCYGSETWQLVQRVETMDRRGQRRWREAQEFQVGYRRVVGSAGEWFVQAEMTLQSGDPEQLRENNRALLTRRGEQQPTRLPNAGSVFRNPQDDYAARLIDSAGLKGLRSGNAMVSDKHANFIVNLGDAQAKDIESLITQIQAEVWRVHGVRLETEVHIVGEVKPQS